MKKPLPPDLSALTRDELESIVMMLWDRLAALESKVSKTSHNSSKPPSSDGLAKKTSSLRQPSGKSAGGQAGHKGSTLKRVAEPTATKHHRLPEQCMRCQTPLPLELVQVMERRQVFDVPAQGFEVTEHCTLSLVCQCGQLHESAFPAEINQPVQYGPNVRALGVHLTQGQMLPFARAAELIEDVYGLRVSPGTLVTWVGQARQALQGSADLIAQTLHAAPVVRADESGLRVAGKLHWLHIAATPNLTWYGVHAKRGMEAIEAHGILPKRVGVLVHDCWSPYWQLDGSTHALCNAHLLRELVYVQELTGQAWPQAMTNLLLGANELSEAVRSQQRTLSADDIAAFFTLYDDILHEGQKLNPEVLRPDGKRGRAAQSVAFNLLRRFRQHAAPILRFLRNPTVPFTNNVAERAVRMPKVKQKISGCFRTLDGAENFCVIRSCLDTLRKQGHRMLEVLRRAFHSDPIMPTV